jgi:ABC-type multidrug transport system fused ATPase/permease subunit
MSNKALEKYYRIPKKTFIFLCTCILIIAISYVTTPVLVRALIDALIPTQDTNAILSGVIILMLIEVISLLVNFSFHRNLNKLYTSYEKQVLDLSLESFFERNSMEGPDFSTFWKRGLSQINQNFLKKKWDFYKDSAIIVFLAIVSVFIHYLAGLLILGIIFLNTVIQILLNTRKIKTRFNFYNSKDKEEANLDFFLGNLSQFYQLKMVDDKKRYLKTLINDRLGYSDEFRKDNDLVFNISRFVRSFSMLCIVSIGSYGYIDNSISMGAIWAMLIVVFRIGGPLQRTTTWFMGQASVAKWLDNFGKLTSGENVIFTQSENYNRNFRLLDRTLKKNTKILIELKGQLGDFYKDLNYWLVKVNRQRDLIFVHDRNWFLLDENFQVENNDYVLLLKPAIPIWDSFRSILLANNTQTIIILYRKKEGLPSWTSPILKDFHNLELDSGQLSLKE